MFPEAILPVPLHRARLRERGFNQAVELARPVAKALCLPLALGLCHRTHATPAQSGLGSAAVRRRNVAGAFRVRRDVNGLQRVVLVDDVVTTGATVTELATSLRAAGVTEVVVWACARVV
jgi:ComF family protein